MTKLRKEWFTEMASVQACVQGSLYWKLDHLVIFALQSQSLLLLYQIHYIPALMCRRLHSRSLLLVTGYFRSRRLSCMRWKASVLSVGPLFDLGSYISYINLLHLYGRLSPVLSYDSALRNILLSHLICKVQ